MVSSILVYQYGVPAELAPASIIPVLFWLAPAGSSDDRGQRGHRVEVTVDSVQYGPLHRQLCRYRAVQISTVYTSSSLQARLTGWCGA